MRDPKRIDKIVRQLRTTWKQSPDLRLGQLLVIIAGASFEKNPFYYEDDMWLENLESWAELPQI